MLDHDYLVRLVAALMAVSGIMGAMGATVGAVLTTLYFTNRRQ